MNARELISTYKKKKKKEKKEKKKERKEDRQKMIRPTFLRNSRLRGQSHRQHRHHNGEVVYGWSKGGLRVV